MSDQNRATSRATRETGADRGSGEVSLMQVILVLLRRRSLLVAVPTILASVVVVGTLLWPRHYTVHASFLPQSGTATMSGAASLAARFGVALPTEDPTQTPAFYSQVLGSNEVLRQVVLARYTSEGDTVGVSLVEVLNADGDTQELQIEEAIRGLRKLLHVGTRPETGIVDLAVTTDWPQVSYQITVNLLTVVNEFARSQLHQRAGAERQFMRERVDEAEQDLHGAESALEQFMKTNRQYQGAPELMLEHDRLERAVSMRQEVYTSLVQALDSSTLDEARNTPLITVVEPPRVPARPDRRYLALKAALALLVGLTFAIGLSLVQDAWAEASVRNPAIGEEVADLRSSFEGQWRRFTGRGSTRQAGGEGCDK